MRGSLPLKIRIPGCDPIRRLSGTMDDKVLKSLVRMCHTLHEQGRDDLVNAIARGTLKPLQVYNRFKFSRLEDLPHADELPRYADLWPDWIEDLECSDHHRRASRGYCERIGRSLAPDATLHALPAAMAEYRVLHRQHPRTFAAAKNTIAALIKSVLGKRHPLYLKVRDIPELKGQAKRPKHPLTPDQLRDVVRLLGEPWGPMAWTMATTGMGWGEYAGPWEREGEGLRIHGTKTGGRDRLVPLVSPPHRCQGTEQQMRRHLKLVSGGLLTTYDLRRTYAGLMVEAGIPRPRRKAYMGHTADDILSLYEAQEVREYLTRDAEKIRGVLGEPTRADKGLTLMAKS